MAKVESNIQTYNVVIRFPTEKKNEYSRLNERLVQKANELAVLKKSIDNLLDPRSGSRSLDSLNSFIRISCVTLGDSEKLRMSYTRHTQDELYSIASKENTTRTISMELLNNFKNSCDLSPFGGYGKIKEWYEFWK
jgi:hypothetical protein